LFLLAAILGGMTLRRSELRMPALLLLAPVVIIPALILVAIWFPNWSDPAPAEAALYLGLALLGTRQTALLPARPLARASHP
jgi:CHASE2 domain-containing sensor protein